MAKRLSRNTYELQCNRAYFGLLVEALKLHSLRTSRIQTLMKLIAAALHDRIWHSVKYEPDDIYQMLRTCGKGPITFYVMLPQREVELLNQAKVELQDILGHPLSTLDMIAVLLRLSLDVGEDPMGLPD